MTVTLITLGVKNIAKSRKFYSDLFGWEVSSASQDEVVFFKSAGVYVALFGRKDLAADACKKISGTFSGITLAHNVEHNLQVDQMLEKAAKLGATILKPAADTSWGGRSGYFSDPDGHVWEFAWAPMFPFVNGKMQLP